MAFRPIPRFRRGAHRSRSFSSGLLDGEFRRLAFWGLGFRETGFGTSFGGSGIFNAGIGSGLSLFPNLLGSFLNVGTSLFGGPGVLAANALSLAVRLFVSGIEANGTGQGDFSGGDAGYGQAGFGGNFGMQAASAGAPACAPGGLLSLRGRLGAAFANPMRISRLAGASVGILRPCQGRVQLPLVRGKLIPPNCFLGGEMRFREVTFTSRPRAIVSLLLPIIPDWKAPIRSLASLKEAKAMHIRKIAWSMAFVATAAFASAGPK